VKNTRELLRSRVSAVRERLSAITGQSERTILLSTILLISAVSVAIGFIFVRCYSIDVLSSLLVSLPEDCYLDWGTRIGHHCFSDYGLIVGEGMRANPWDPYPFFLPPQFNPAHNNYTAAGMVPVMIFGFLGKWLHTPELGLLAYLLALTIACLTPAVWAARGARGAERVMVFVALGVAAIPAWTAIDRGNSVGFVVPIALAFLIALCRQRWGLVAIMVVLAALIKPQFVVLAVALFAVRQWRLGGLAVGGAVISNLAAYLLWPRDFPATILQSISNTEGFGSWQSLIGVGNVSFAKGVLWIPDAIKNQQTAGRIPEGFLAGPRSVLGYVVLAMVVVAVVALGRRIPPVMAGIAVLTAASLFPALVCPYYLVFALPIGAIIARNPTGPPGSGIFDELAAGSGRRRAVGICVSLAAALTIAQTLKLGPSFPAPILGQMGATGVIGNSMLIVTSVTWVPVLWLLACAAIVVSYARKPAPSCHTDQRPDPEGALDTVADSSRRTAVSATSP
jgi:hypothetical protein